jgi:hypothetical protein
MNVLLSVLQVKHYMRVTSDLLYITFCRKRIEPKIEAKNRTLNPAYILNSVDISVNRFSPTLYNDTHGFMDVEFPTVLILFGG